MQMQVRLIRASASIANVASAYLQMLNGPDESSLLFGLGEHASMDQIDSIDFAVLTTEWFAVNLSSNRWLHRKSLLNGSRATLTVKGVTFMSWGDVTVALTVFDSRGHAVGSTSTSFVGAENLSFHLTETSINGTLRGLPSPDRGISAEAN